MRQKFNTCIKNSKILKNAKYIGIKMYTPNSRIIQSPNTFLVLTRHKYI